MQIARLLISSLRPRERWESMHKLLPSTSIFLRGFRPLLSQISFCLKLVPLSSSFTYWSCGPNNKRRKKTAWCRQLISIFSLRSLFFLFISMSNLVQIFCDLWLDSTRSIIHGSRHDPKLNLSLHTCSMEIQSKNFQFPETHSTGTSDTGGQSNSACESFRSAINGNWSKFPFAQLKACVGPPPNESKRIKSPLTINIQSFKTIFHSALRRLEPINTVLTFSNGPRRWWKASGCLDAEQQQPKNKTNLMFFPIFASLRTRPRNEVKFKLSLNEKT